MYKVHNICIISTLQIIAECLTANHARAKKAGKSLDLRTFIAGRNRLENAGACALGKAFSVSIIAINTYNSG